MVTKSLVVLLSRGIITRGHLSKLVNAPQTITEVQPLLRVGAMQSHAYILYGLRHTLICLEFLHISKYHSFDQITLQQSSKL